MRSTPTRLSASRRTCDVLCDGFLLRYITSFQSGLPSDIVQLLRDSSHTEHRYGLLPRAAVRQGNLRLLQRLWEVCKTHSVYAADDKFSFDDIGYEAVRLSQLEIAEWIDKQNPPLEMEGLVTGDMIAGACKNGQVSTIKWVFTKRPGSEGEISCQDMDMTASYGNVELYKWLDINIEGVKCTTIGMDRAAGNGHLEMVQYLHEHRTEGCTVNAMDYAASNGHFDIVRFLHENRSEGCTTVAMDEAAKNGHFEIVRFLHENRTEGATIHAMSAAADNGHFEIVKYLCENRTEGCNFIAIEDCARNGDLAMVPVPA